MRVLVIGPSPDKSRGGMATVIGEIKNDRWLNSEFDIEVYESYRDGNMCYRAAYSLYAYLRFLLTKRGYDVYHIHAASRTSTFRKGCYAAAARHWGGKVIFHIHGAQYLIFYNEECGSRKKKKVVDILRSADLVLALSEDWKRKFDETFGLTNCAVLENGINMKALAPAVTDIRRFQKSFLFLGRMGQRKGTYDLIDAVDLARESVPDIKCYLAGDGEVEKVRALVGERGLEGNIEVVGWADFDKKLSLLGQVSTVVLPSYNEGLPMAVLEGMACGKAIISTHVGAIPEVVKAENGILLEPGDIQGFGEAFVRCCRDAELMEGFSENNLRTIEERFSMEAMHQRLAEYYRRCGQ